MLSFFVSGLGYWLSLACILIFLIITHLSTKQNIRFQLVIVGVMGLIPILNFIVIVSLLAVTIITIIKNIK